MACSQKNTTFDLCGVVSGVQPWSGVACTMHLLTQLHHFLLVERRSMGLGSFFPNKKAFAHVIPFGPFCFLLMVKLT